MLLISLYLCGLPSGKALAPRAGRWVSGDIFAEGRLGGETPSKVVEKSGIKRLKLAKKWYICMIALVNPAMS